MRRSPRGCATSWPSGTSRPRSGLDRVFNCASVHRLVDRPSLGAMPELPEVESLAAFLRENAVGRAVARIDVVGDLLPEDLRPADHRAERPDGDRRRAGTASSSTSTSTACTWSPTWRVRAGCGGRTGCRRHRRGQARVRSPCASISRAKSGSTSPRRARRSVSRCTSCAIRRTSRASRPWARTRSGRASASRRWPTILAGRRTQIKGVLRDQSVIAGIGNAYSDEVLHVARMSPYKLAAEPRPGPRSPRSTRRS